MSRQPTLAFDLDDTIVDHMPHRRMLAERFGLAHLSDAALYRLHEERVSSDTLRAFKRALYGRLSRHAPPFPHAVAALREITVRTPAVIISRRVHEAAHARAWIRRHLPFFPLDRVHFTCRDEEKSAVARVLGVGVFVDDSPEVLLHLPSDIRRILFDRFSLHQNGEWERTASWHELLDALQQR